MLVKHAITKSLLHLASVLQQAVDQKADSARVITDQLVSDGHRLLVKVVLRVAVRAFLSRLVSLVLNSSQSVVCSRCLS